jgi:hypothetical protein
MYGTIESVVGYMFPEPGEILGLSRYLQSLKELRRLGKAHPDMKVLPAHRFYYDDQWNMVDLTRRVDELIEHHVRRCADIVDIVSRGHGDNRRNRSAAFQAIPSERPGETHGLNEILSHCELLVGWGDLVETGSHRYEASGTRLFETLIPSLEECAQPVIKSEPFLQNIYKTLNNPS